MVRLNVPKLQRKYKTSKKVISILQLTIKEIVVDLGIDNKDIKDYMTEMYSKAFVAYNSLDTDLKEEVLDSAENLVELYQDI